MDSVDQEFRQSTAGMAHLCSLMYKASARITQKAAAWMDTSFPT